MNEINASTNIQISNGNYREQFNASGNFTQNAVGGNGGILSVTTTAVVVPYGSVAVVGWAWLKNVDLTNYIQFGPDNGGGTQIVLGRLYPGEFAILRLEPGVVLKAKANTATALLQFQVNAN